MKMQSIFKGKGKTVHGKGLFTRVFKTVYRLPFTVYLLIFAALLASGCSQDPTMAGGSSEIGNAGVAGVIRDEEEKPSPGVEVALIPQDYVPFEKDLPRLPKRAVGAGAAGKVLSAVTDDHGRFRFLDASPGTYNIIARHAEEQTAAIIRDVRVIEDEFTDTLEAVLRTTGAFTVYLNELQPEEDGHLYLPGTDIYTRLDAVDLTAGIAIMNEIPSGAYPDVSYARPGKTSGPMISREEVRLEPGESSVIGPYASWTQKKKVMINTAVSGAGVSGDLHDFPLLVRLNSSSSSSSTFDFTDAEPDGSDLRITKSDGITFLAYEIEEWDYVNGKAAVWVRMDTILGNNDTQHIFMYSGHGDAPAQSSGAAVFQAETGFKGVWHLSDNAGNSTVSDALGLNDGTMKLNLTEMNTSEAVTSGAIGSSVDFRGPPEKHWIDLGADRSFVNSASEITISLWMNSRIDTMNTTEMFNFSKAGPLADKEPESRISLAINLDKLHMQTRAPDSTDLQGVKTSRGFETGEWYHVVGIMKAPQDSIFLYVNGELWASKEVNFTADVTGALNSTSSSIGANDTGRDDYFIGRLDEARLELTARSPDWIKMCYENQKQNSTVVMME